MLKYRVTHHLSTAYHPQTSGQVKVSNRGLKRILKRTIGENHASWSNKLDDSLWAFRTAYKTPIGCTAYKLVFGNVCHLLIKLEHKAYWALKQANFDLAVAGDHRKIQLNELNELRDHAYENSLIYKKKTKRIHDFKIKNCVFNVGDRVLLFNSRLKIFLGKLKTRWSGPFTITKVFPYDTVELSQANGPNFKVNGHRVKHYFRGDVPQLEDPPPEVLMADNRTMAELLQAPTEGYEGAIVIPEIAANNFELKHECLKIIESKSKVRQSRAKAVVAKESTISSTPSISSDVAELKDMVKALLLDKKNQSSAPAPSPTLAPVNAVEPNCVTCGATHSYQNCPATSGNAYRDNIQYFPPHQNSQNNFNWENNFNQNRGGNFNQSNFKQGQLHRPLVNQPPAYQAPAYQASIPQTQSVSKTNFKSYVKANDAVLRNTQNQGQNMQIQMANLTDMLSKFMSSNTTSSLGSGTLPSNTITNPKEELKGITIQCDVSYQGPTIPTPSKVVKQGTEVTKNQVQTPSSQSTAPVQSS
uniref:Reverse transcriptase domain-containing protein n=1 Tax=Tanacetum cinerariifolium TaxID=118510 RepID=A0A699H2N1_TANCI|nr:reverse transcriptase domain-containing protein [Tanacetum cinerariifolium]